ncbi:uncharacterized protein LOC105833624 isoform X3 [Monomorium pharaonis]|uniref:uncharacterized protein LOC105833624 isoform X3 n=1 Tax=Monomorium pharaonis TaxID=307658 RepID=UPI0017474E87|nr:uncharacterized protein LOC105833624 isoform X3 [Monomorium pharaonis]
MMAQNENINKYLRDDTIFTKINRQFISMDPDDMKHNNAILIQIFENLIDAMRQQSPLFCETFQRIVWAGSYYKGTRFGQPEEYDLNFVINLFKIFKERDIKFSTDRPGFIKIRTVWRNGNSTNNLKLDSKACRELNSFIDKVDEVNEEYLNQEKFRNWMEKIVNKAINAIGENNRIQFDGCVLEKSKKSGPAFTLTFQLLGSGKIIDVDVVPVLAFSTRILPPRCSKMNILEKLRTSQKWKSVASYYLETLCYHEKERFHKSHSNSYTFLFFTMLEKLHEAFQNGYIRYYWDDDHNLLENIGFYEMRNMENRLNKVLKNIRKTIKNDKYAIAKCVLDMDELITLKRLENVSIPEPEPEFDPEICKYYTS